MEKIQRLSFINQPGVMIEPQVGSISLLRDDAIEYSDRYSTNAALENAVINGKLPMVIDAIERGANIHLNTYTGSMVEMAAAWGHIDVLRWLLDNGAHLRRQTFTGKTALMFAARWGRTEAVRLLIDRGDDASVADRQGRTAHSKATEYGHLETLKVLMKAAPEVLRGRVGYPLLLTAVCGHRDNIVVYLLKQWGCDPNQPDQDGYTPLMYALSINNLPITQRLLRHGAIPMSYRGDIVGGIPRLALVGIMAGYGIMKEMYNAGTDIFHVVHGSIFNAYLRDRTEEEVAYLLEIRDQTPTPPLRTLVITFCRCHGLTDRVASKTLLMLPNRRKWERAYQLRLTIAQRNQYGRDHSPSKRQR